jgi:ABC-2 type transport system permease protein
MGNLAFARALATTNVKGTFALRGAFLVQAAFMVLNNLAFFVFWSALMQHVPTLRGWRIDDVELLFGLVAASFGLLMTVAGGVRYLGRFIDEGDLDTLMTQPRPVLLHAIGLRSQPSGVGDVVSGIAFIIWSGHVSWRTLPVTLVAILASAVVFFASGVVFFSLAFWLGKVDSLARQLWELLITFSLYPEPLFGGLLRVALFTILPAGFAAYVPVRVINQASWLDVGLLVTGAAVYLAIAIAVFEAGLRRYASGSRFSTFG